MKLSTLALLLLSSAYSAAIEPKMVAQEVLPNKPNLFTADDGDPTSITISTKNAIYVGDCTPSQAFEFPLGSHAGRGVVGVENCIKADSIDVISDTHTTTRTGEAEGNFFALEQPDQSDWCGIAFVYNDNGNGAGMASVMCSEDTHIIVILRDDDTDGAAESSLTVSATTSCDDQGNMQFELDEKVAARIQGYIQGWL